MAAGTLYLIPTFLGENKPSVITDEAKEVIGTLDYFIVENARSARRFLRAVGYTKNFDTEVTIYEMSKHGSNAWSQVLAAVVEGKNAGLLSEAGNPCIADPGNTAVAYAHKKNITIYPLVGPSAILLALIASGFNGQQFTFHGYIPVNGIERSKAIKKTESELLRTGYTQLFMETPFRNNQLMGDLLKNLQATTYISVAMDLTLPTQKIHTMTAKEWAATKFDFHKHYCVFGIGKP